MRDKETLASLEKKSWQLWGLILGLFLIVGFTSIAYFYISEILLGYISGVLFIGFTLLSILFCVYAVIKERTIRRLRITLMEVKAKAEVAEAIKADKKYWESITVSMLEPLIVVRPNGKINTINKATKRLLGYEEGELIDKPVNIIFKEKEIAERVMRESSIENVETNYLTKDKGEIPVSFSSSMMKDKEKRIIGIVCVARNLSEIKNITKELNERIIDLEKFQKVAMGREKRIIELKDKVWELEKKLEEKKD